MNVHSLNMLRDAILVNYHDLDKLACLHSCLKTILGQSAIQ